MSDAVDFDSVLSDLREPSAVPASILPSTSPAPKRRRGAATLTIVPLRWSEAKMNYVQDEDEPPWDTSVAEFCADNQDDPDLCREVRRLRAGQKTRAGGGAAPTIEIRKFSRSKKKWISKALRKHAPGALHRQLKIPAGERIARWALASAVA